MSTTDEFSLFYKQILIEVLHKSVDFSVCSYLRLTSLGEAAHKAAHKQSLTAPLLQSSSGPDYKDALLW